MKKIFLLSVMLVFVSSLNFAGDETVIKPGLNSVKVFLHGAELSYSAKVKLNKGMNDIVFTGLSTSIDQNSISVSAKGDAVIMSVGQQFNFLRSQEKTPQIKLLEDSLETLNKSLSMNQDESSVLNEEVGLLMANKSIGNEKIGVSISELQKMAEFFRKRLTEIKSKMYDLSFAAKKIQKNIDRIQNQLNELNNQINKPTNEIIVSISAKSAATYEIDFSYLMRDAGWVPAYDIRVDKLNSPAQLNYKANVWQNGGFDWNDVEIILSTRNPVANNNKPELYPWFIDFARPMLYREMKGAANKSLDAANMQVMAAPTAGASETMADYFEMNDRQLSVEFTPQIKYSIASDNKPHSVALQDFTVPARYEYYAAPKLDNNAFLIGYLTDWGNYNLLQGKANIYFENSFVGQSNINPGTTKDTLVLSLGRDQNISVSREVLKDFSEDKFLSSNVERTFAFEIKIKNNKKTAAKVLVEDQIPISKNEDITVKLIESSGAVYDSDSGKLKWLVDVDGGKSVSKKLIYSVKYPKDKVIPGL
ncbi:MAG: mucoidy inhibitor MuiA family protein [Bacteroidetes bacterium]|nr:mucoidy inhibitor MuiA family protein [Bacteroidota bacterium]